MGTPRPLVVIFDPGFPEGRREWRMTQSEASRLSPHTMRLGHAYSDLNDVWDDDRGTKALPPPYRYANSLVTGQEYVDDGSNFVCWVKPDDRDAAVTEAWEKYKTREDYKVWYAQQLAEHGGSPGWRHHGCSHGDGICMG